MACLAHGRTGLVVGVSAQRVAKLFPVRLAHLAHREFAALRAARDAGLPVPAPIRLKMSRHGVGLIMDRVQGQTLNDQFLGRPFGGVRLFLALRRMARLHARINAVAAPELECRREAMVQAVRASGLDAVCQEAALAPLNDPCPLMLCHGDMHISNIFWSTNGLVVVDWQDAGAGWPEYDAARAFLIFLFGESSRTFGRRMAAEAYLHWYCRYSGLRREDVQRWLPTAAAVRLGGGTVQEGRAALIAFTARWVHGPQAGVPSTMTNGAKSVT
ncbi:MAG: aminoglycoside phosphotransferase family protein [Rhodospirillaceae bacterium]